MRNRKVILFGFILFVSIEIFSFENSQMEKTPTVLEKIWSNLIQGSLEIKEKEMLEEESLIKKKTLEGRYSPSVSIKNTINSSEENSNNTYPESLNTLVSFLQPLPGGLSVGLNTNINSNYFNDNENDFIQQLPSLSFVVEQSLFPFYFQKKNIDPLKENYENNFIIASIEKRITIQNLLIEVTKIYINMRMQKRQIEIYRKYLEYYNLEQMANLQLYKTNKISYSKIIEIKQSVIDYQAELDELIISYLANEKELNVFIHTLGDEILLGELPNYMQKSIEPFIAGYSENEKKILEIQKQSFINAKINRKQEYAPKLGIEFNPSFALDQTELTNWKDSWKKDSSKYIWSLSVYLDLSDFLLSKTRKDNLLEDNQLSLIDTQLIENELKWKASQDELQRTLSLFCKKKEQLENLYQEVKKLHDDILSLYEQRRVSEIDYKKVLIQKDSQYSLIENASDMIWFYKFVMYLKGIK